MEEPLQVNFRRLSLRALKIVEVAETSSEMRIFEATGEVL